MPGQNDSTHQPSRNGSTATRIADRVKEHAAAQLSTQKDRATEGLGSVVSAVRSTTNSLRDQQHDTVARYVEQAADQIERLSERLKDKDVTELLDDAQRLARRQPALFVGGAFALGLVGARFLKSSSPDDDRSYTREAYDYRPGASESSGSTSGLYGANSSSSSSSARGTIASSGDVTGRGGTSDLGGTGASGYVSGSSRSGSTTPPRSGPGSYGTTSGRPDDER